MLEMLLEKAKYYLKNTDAIITRIDIQFNRNTYLYSARVWTDKKSVYDIFVTQYGIDVIEIEGDEE